MLISQQPLRYFLAPPPPLPLLLPPLPAVSLIATESMLVPPL